MNKKNVHIATELLKTEVLRRGLKLVWLAIKTQISTPVLSKIINGKLSVKPNDKRIRAIARVLRLKFTDCIKERDT